MSRRTKPFLTAGLAITVLAASLLASSVASAADPVAYNHGSAYLRLPSTPYEDASCVQRTIDLNAGTYRWQVYDRWWASNWAITRSTRSIWLKAGRYTWRDCMQSAAPPAGYSTRGYYHTSRLSVSGGAAELRAYMVAASGTGSYDYGGSLLRTGD